MTDNAPSKYGVSKHVGRQWCQTSSVASHQTSCDVPWHAISEVNEPHGGSAVWSERIRTATVVMLSSICASECRRCRCCISIRSRRTKVGETWALGAETRRLALSDLWFLLPLIAAGWRMPLLTSCVVMKFAFVPRGLFFCSRILRTFSRANNERGKNETQT